MDYGADVAMSVLVRADRAAAFADALRELTAGAVAAQKIGEEFCGVPIE